jgi:hypothetical protein
MRQALENVALAKHVIFWVNEKLVKRWILFFFFDWDFYNYRVGQNDGILCFALLVYQYWSILDVR